MGRPVRETCATHRRTSARPNACSATAPRCRSTRDYVERSSGPARRRSGGVPQSPVPPEERALVRGILVLAVVELLEFPRSSTRGHPAESGLQLTHGSAGIRSKHKSTLWGGPL